MPAKPYLFYFEEAVDCWIPAPERVDTLIDVENQLDPGETYEIKFKRVDLTDHQYENLPDVDD